MSKEKIRALKEDRAKIEPEFRAIAADLDRQVQEKLNAAGLGTIIQEARALIEKERQRLQSKADQLLGQIEALESIFGAEEKEEADVDTDIAPTADAQEIEA